MTLSAASEKKLVGVKPALVKVIRRAAEITKQPFQIVQGNRTLAQQRALYAQGRTKTLKSSHIGGRAIDYAALVGGKISWNDKHYPAIAKAFKQAAKELKTPIIWGGDWKKTKDWGHIQLA
jgi:peptidoglycan L-alanyl-D-glutamate endopeptidase CwlK